MIDPQNKATAVGAVDGKAYAIAGGSYRIVISGKETGGAYALIEMMVPPGNGPGPHAHAEMQESFYVLEGEVEVKTEAGNYTATKGSFINIPLGGLVHCFKNQSDKMARLLCTVIPAGLEDLFAEIGQPTEFGVFLPPPPLDDAARQKLMALAKKYNQKFYPPDYLDKI